VEFHRTAAKYIADANHTEGLSGMDWAKSVQDAHFRFPQQVKDGGQDNWPIMRGGRCTDKNQSQQRVLHAATVILNHSYCFFYSPSSF